MIPLWYNGMWSQANNDRLDQLAVGRRRQPYPCTWNDFWEMGAVLAAQIEPAG